MSEEADINAKLILAADGRLEDVKALLAQGADVDAGDKFGETALMTASRQDHKDIVHYLVNNAQANINKYYKQTGWTALMFAGFFGHLDLVRYLVAVGADTTIKNRKGETVLDQKPCMGKLEDVVRAVEEGQAMIGNPPDLLAANEVVKEKEPLDEEKAALYARAQQYTKIMVVDMNTALVQFRELYERTCSDFHQSPAPGVMAVLDQLIAKEIPLDTLPLNNRYQNDKLADSQVFPLFEVLGHGFPNCPFTTLDLSYNYIRNAGAKAIAVYLTQTNTLTSLDLSGNKCEQLGVEKLSQSLYGQKTLKSLDLSYNPVGDEGMAKLAASLAANGTLEAVNMANTDLGTVSLMKLASVLRSNGALTDLNVASPLLYSREEETTIAIAKALADNTNLRSLNMAHHRMEDFGVGWLADYLVKNSGLTSLDLSCNRITATGVAQLAKAIAVRSVPCTIRLNGCPLRGREHDEIFEEIEIADAEGSPMAVTFLSEDEAHELVAEPRG